VSYYRLGKATTPGNSAEITFRSINNNSDSNSLSFGFFNSQYLLNLTKNGNLGIGSNLFIPTQKLDVDGSVRVRTLNSGTASDSIVTADANGVLRRRNANSLLSSNLYTADGALTGNRTVTQGTNILNFNATPTADYTAGINITNNAAGNPGITILNMTSPNSDTSFFRIGKIISTGNIAEISYSHKGNNNDTNRLSFGFHSTRYLLNLMKNGNLSVGNTIATEKLDVDGGARIRSLGTGASTDSIVTVDGSGVLRRRNANSLLSSNLYTANGALTGNRTVTQGTNTLSFTSGASASGSHFSVDGSTFSVDAFNNRIGIGTIAPEETLDVRGNMQLGNNDTTNFITLRGVTGDGSGHTYIGNRLYGGPDKAELIMYQGNDAGTVAGPDRIRLMSGELKFQTISTTSIANTTFPSIANDPAFVDRMTIKSDGKIGVGTMSPTDNLDVNGTARVRTMAGAASSDVVVYADANGVLKKGTQTASQTGKILNAVYVDDPAYVNTSFGSTTYTDLITYTYTPVSTNSKILVEYDNQNYTMNGVTSGGTDDWNSQLIIGGGSPPTVNYWAANIGVNGPSFRSSALLPIKGVSTNTSTTPITIKVQIRRVSSDDIITFSGTNGTLVIHEIGN
jgi:hypothetical protein